MWQSNNKLESYSYPAGGIAPSTYALKRHSYLEKAKYRLHRERSFKFLGTRFFSAG